MSTTICSKSGTPEREEIEVSCQVKVHPKFYIENIVPSTEQSSRRRSKRNIDKEQNVRTGPCDMDIEEGSCVPKDKDTSKRSSSANTVKEVEIDTNAHLSKMKSVKVLIKKWDPEKIKSQETVVRTKESKKRSRTEEASMVTNETNGNNYSKRKSTRKGVDSDFVCHVNVMNDDSCPNKIKDIGISDIEETKKRDSGDINSNIRLKRKRKFDTYKGDDFETKKREQELVSRSLRKKANKEVHIKIVDKLGLNEISVPVKENSRLLKMKTKEQCADKFGKSVDSGQRINDSDTLAHLGLSDGDVIDASEDTPALLGLSDGDGREVSEDTPAHSSDGAVTEAPEDTTAHFGLRDGDDIEAPQNITAHFGLSDGDDIKAPENIAAHIGLSDCDGKEASDLQSLNSAESEDETSTAELLRKEKEVIDIKRKLILNVQCRTTQKSDGEGDTEGQQGLKEDFADSFVQSLHKHPEASIKDTASPKSNLIEIRSDEETEIEYMEQIPSHVEEQEGNGNKSYNYVCIEIETILASNSRSKEITQIGAFKENSIGNSDAQFFKAVAPKNLDYYLENYKLGGDLLQTLHMQMNDCGKFEFRKQFEIMDEGRVATKCVSEEEALEEFSSYLATVENCIIVSLNEENIKLLVDKIKLLGSKNKRIHMDSVKGFCTWSSYLRESGASKEDLNQEFEDWYDTFVDGGYLKESSNETVKKHADVVAKMVHDSITTLLSLSHILVKASRPIESLLWNQRPEENEPSNSEIQYLELFSSLRHDFPVTITLKKLETYDISSEDEGDARNINDDYSEDEDGDERNRNELNINWLKLAKTRRQEHKDHSSDEQESETELHIDTSMEDLEGYFNDATETSQDEHSIRTQSDKNALKCPYCQKSFQTYEEKTAHVMKCNPSYEDRSRCPLCSKEFLGNHSKPAIISRNQHIIKKHNPNNFDQPPILPLEFQCQKCYIWFPSLSRNLLHVCFRVDPQTPLFLKCQHCLESFETYEVKTTHVLKCNPSPTFNDLLPKSVQNAPRKRMTFENVPSASVQAKVHSSKPSKVQSVKPTCPVCDKKCKSIHSRNDHIIAKHNPNNFDQLPILSLELQCQKCYRWFGKVIPPSHKCSKENQKIPLFLECQHCNGSFKNYQEKTAHMLKCKSQVTTKNVSDNAVPNVSTKEATPIETVKSVNTGDAASKTVSSDPIKDSTQSKTATVCKSGPSQSTRGYMDLDFPSDVPVFWRFRQPQSSFVNGGFGRLPHPQADLASRGFRRFPHPQAGIGRDFAGFYHQQINPVNARFQRFHQPVNGEFPHPQVGPANEGLGRFPHPQTGPVNGGFGGRFPHPQAEPVNGEYREFHHPQVGPVNGRFQHPQAAPVNEEYREFHHPQVGPVNGRFQHPQADPVNGEYGELHHPQAGPVNGRFQHPQADPVNGEYREFHHPQVGPVNGRFQHPQADPVNGEYGELHHL